MLASDLARATYAKLQRQGIPATVCRGTSGDDFNFFYSSFTYWSNNCLGWVPDLANKPKICLYCLTTKPPMREFGARAQINDFRNELRDSNRLPGQADEPSKSGKSGLSSVSASSEHRCKSNKGDATPKNKQNRKSKTKTLKKKTKK